LFAYRFIPSSKALKKNCFNIVYLECSTTLPTYENAMLFSGGRQTNYFNSHELTYMCDTNFASEINPIMCTCDTTTNPNNPMWDCSLPLDSICLRSKFYLHEIT